MPCFVDIKARSVAVFDGANRKMSLKAAKVAKSALFVLSVAGYLCVFCVTKYC